MRCNEFDARIDEMLSGVLHPDANQHLRHCERCTSHLRSRATVQDGLRQLASAAVPGPSRATDRAVMDAYRQLQRRRPAASAPAAQGARLLTFAGSGHAPAPARGSRTWMTSAAAAAVVFAVLGSAAHLWNGVSTVNAPSVAGAPAASAPARTASAANAPGHAVMAANVAENAANMVVRRLWQHRPAPLSSPSNDSQANDSQVNAGQSEAASLPPEPPALAAEDSTPAQSSAAPVMHLASSGAVGGAASVAQSASSTWPGYSNLMYCDPVVCSGPMEVVHIKVPAGQVKPNLGSTEGNGFVNAEVVVGPDGVARAIRVAN